jgi:hypothetical protein
VVENSDIFLNEASGLPLLVRFMLSYRRQRSAWAIGPVAWDGFRSDRRNQSPETPPDPLALLAKRVILRGVSCVVGPPLRVPIWEDHQSAGGAKGEGVCRRS